MPHKDASAFDRDVEQQTADMDKIESQIMNAPDTVIAESTNTMTQSAKCLMLCANRVGLCTRRNQLGCACAAGCQCNRGEADATCSEHCHPANQMQFVYGYHDSDHFSPHFWRTTIGDTLVNYALVRECLGGCQKRGKCKPRFCPRHPMGGFKCTACRRMSSVARPPPRRPARHYSNGKRKPSKQSKAIKKIAKKLAKKILNKLTGKKNGKQNGKKPKSNGVKPKGKAGKKKPRNERDDEPQFRSVRPGEGYTNERRDLRYNAPKQRRSGRRGRGRGRRLEYDAPDPSRGNRLDIRSDKYGTAVRMAPRDNRPIQPRRVKPFNVLYPKLHGENYADNYPVDPTMEQDPIAFPIPKTYVDDPYIPVGSLNPVKPYINNPQPRTTTFRTVPDMLQPQAQTEIIIAG